jgi:hypothetical protein
MNQPPRKKPLPEKTASKKLSASVKDKKADSKDIERAVYDGMQDLRAEKAKQK